MNIYWYCLIIYFKVSKKNFKEENVFGLMEIVNLWFFFWNVGVLISGEFKYLVYRGNEGSFEKFFKIMVLLLG